jgi:hypothetical protein
MEKQKQNSRAPLVVTIVMLVMLLPVFYFLSIGPVVYMSTSARFLNAYCYPLNVAIGYCKPLGKLANWYVNLFLDRTDPTERG